MSERYAALMFGVLLLIVSGCTDEETREDVSSQPMYYQHVGDRYEILKPLHAYGIRRHSGAPVGYILLTPPPGIQGSEIGFDVPVTPGSTIEILKVIKTNRWPDPDITLMVRLKGALLPVDRPIHVDLFRGNEGKGGVPLNPAIYRKLDSKPQVGQ